MQQDPKKVKREIREPLKPGVPLVAPIKLPEPVPVKKS